MDGMRGRYIKLLPICVTHLVGAMNVEYPVLPVNSFIEYVLKFSLRKKIKELVAI